MSIHCERVTDKLLCVSQMVIEEVSVLQTQLEIEKSCRENAEALATKLNCENRKLKYLSLSSRPCLDELLPSISDCISLEEEADPQEHSPDPYAQYQRQVKDLQETVNTLLEEKKQLACQLQEQQRQLEELTALTVKEQAEMKELHKTIEQQSKTIKRFNRVSMMATQEYEGLKEQLDLEHNLRQKAETYAHEMLVKQKEANRQSMILLQQMDPSVQLLKALEDVANMTKTLEQERLQHQEKVHHPSTYLQCQKERHTPCIHLNNHVADKLMQMLGDVLGSLIAIMRKSSKAGKGSPKLEQAPVTEGVDDVKVKAVNEMMERIKHGVVLRPVKGQDTKVNLSIPSTEEKQQETAMEELKGILDTVKKSPSRGLQETLPVKKDSELEVILRRRRKQACDTASDSPISKVCSSDSLNGRHSSDSGRETDGPGGGSLSGSEAGSRSSSDSGREAVPTQSCSEQGAEPDGLRQTGTYHTPLSGKGPCEPTDNSSCAWEQKDEDQEKTEWPSQMQPQPLSEEPQGVLSSSEDHSSAVNSSMDAEC
uniref:Shootin-1 n=1 Tax=Electrophorus electricus TaxID=8005 RepID=A0A4W4G0N2_ELEEL